MTTPDPHELYHTMSDAFDADECAYALEVSRDLLRHCPEFGIGWLTQGMILVAMARYDEAEESIYRALELLPLKSINHGYVQLGHLFRERGDYEGAERHYRTALNLAPDNAGRYVYLGGVLAKKGDFVAAEEVHRNGTLCSKEDIDESYLNLGYVLRAQERYEEARECFNKAIELSPDYEEAIVAKVDVEKAIEHISRL